MNIKSLFRVVFLTVSTLLATSCSKSSDEPMDPAGTITVNMMDEDHGKTSLGNSDVYIDKGNNFYGPSCSMVSLGKKNGLGNLTTPVLHGLSSKIAVESGYAYQVFKSLAVREFPSGKLALNITADYYNVYVLSQIKQNDAVVGSTVKFVLADVPDYDLPEYDSKIGTFSYEGEEITINLSTSDFEYEPISGGSNRTDFEKKGNKLIIKLVKKVEPDNFGAYIRINESYTYVYGTVQK